MQHGISNTFYMFHRTGVKTKLVFSVSISWFCVYCSIGWKCCQQHYMSVSCQTKFSADTTNRAVIGAEIKFTIATLYFTRLPVSGLQSPYSNHKRNILTCVCYEHISIKVIRQLWLREILAMMFVKNITFIREPCQWGTVI